MNGKVAAIFMAPEAGEPLVPIETAALEAGKGLVGDRYFRRVGTFSEKLKENNDWEVTLIESEEIECYNAAHDDTLSAGAFRRNIITTDVRLNELTGHRFYVGKAMLEGLRLCEPCAYLGSLLGPDVVKAMAHKAGLRARIITGASIRPGDAIGVSN